MIEWNGMEFKLQVKCHFVWKPGFSHVIKLLPQGVGFDRSSGEPLKGLQIVADLQLLDFGNPVIYDSPSLWRTIWALSVFLS